jgi:hypothetical protein
LRECTVAFFSCNYKQPTGLVLNPGLHALCFRGNQRGSEGYEEHVAGVGLLSSTIKEYQAKLGVTTKFLLHNVLWANEEGLFGYYAKRVRVQLVSPRSWLV